MLLHFLFVFATERLQCLRYDRIQTRMVCKTIPFLNGYLCRGVDRRLVLYVRITYAIVTLFIAPWSRELSACHLFLVITRVVEELRHSSKCTHHNTSMYLRVCVPKTRLVTLLFEHIRLSAFSLKLISERK